MTKEEVEDFLSELIDFAYDCDFDNWTDDHNFDDLQEFDNLFQSGRIGLK